MYKRFESGASNECNGKVTSSPLRGMLKSYDKRSSNKTCPVLVAFIDRGTKNEETAHMTRVSRRYSEIVADAMSDVGQEAAGKEDLATLRKGFRRLRRCF